MEPTIFLQQLRSKTAKSHQLMEQNNAAQLLMSQAVTIADYAHYLNSLYGFVHGFEKMVFPLLQQHTLLQLDDRKKSHLIETDLALLHHAVPLSFVSDALFSTHFKTTAAALGGMYVLEGSTLGGQIISRHLSKILGDSVAGKTNYFTAYAGQTGSMWKSFLQLLCEAGATTANKDEIIDSAINTFSLLNNCLSKHSYKLVEYEN